MNDPSRRLFIQRSVGLIAAGTLGRTAFTAAEAATTTRSYTAGKSLIEIDGAFVWISQLLSWSPETVLHRLSPLTPQTVPAQLQFVVPCEPSGWASLKPWIENAIAHQSDRRNGRVVTLDYDYNVVSQFDFTAGSVSSVACPGVDAANRTMVSLTITVQAESIRFEKSGGPRPYTPYKSATSKPWPMYAYQLIATPPISELRYVGWVSPFTLTQGATGGTFDFRIPADRAAPFVEAMRARRVLEPTKTDTLQLFGLQANMQPNGYVFTFLNWSVQNVVNSGTTIDTTPLHTVRIGYQDARIQLP